MAKLFAEGGDLEQMPQSAASDLNLQFAKYPLLGPQAKMLTSS